MLKDYSTSMGFKRNLLGTMRKGGFSERDPSKHVKHFYRNQGEIN